MAFLRALEGDFGVEVIEDAFLIETELLIDWYLPNYGTAPSPAAREDFVRLWRRALEPALARISNHGDGG